MNSYLSRFPPPENVSFSTGELIEIVIGMIPHSWVTSMMSAGIEPREMGYNELIDHLVNLESTVSASSPEDTNHNSKKKRSEKSSKSGENSKSQNKERKSSSSKTKKAISSARC